MKFDELYKKVIDSCKAFEERQVPIHLDFKIEDFRDALIESNETIEKLVGAKKSAEQILQNLLDCGLIKEWYFNGKFNAVLKADDPHLEIAELKKKLEDAKADAAETLALLEERNRQVGELTENERRLKRALWLARLRALRGFSVLTYFQVLRVKGKESNMDFDEMAYRINLACVKCRAKAEEYK